MHVGLGSMQGAGMHRCGRARGTGAVQVHGVQARGRATCGRTGCWSRRVYVGAESGGVGRWGCRRAGVHGGVHARWVRQVHCLQVGDAGRRGSQGEPAARGHPWVLGMACGWERSAVMQRERCAAPWCQPGGAVLAGRRFGSGWLGVLL